MKPSLLITGLIILSLLVAGCSKTIVSASWKDPNFTGKIEKVYIVGISKQDTIRRIFEDDFRAQLAAYGATGVPSYQNLPNSKEINKDMIAAKAIENGADAIMMARAIGKRTEQVVNPGYVSSYGYGPYGGYYPDPYYRDYGVYYTQSWDSIYMPATVSQYEVVIIETNIYDARTSELIWSAQLEIILEGNLQGLIDEFAETVTKDLNAKGLI